MDLIYPDAASFCDNFRLPRTSNVAGSTTTMALEDDSLQESIQELLKLLSAIKSNSTETEVEDYMSLLANSLDNEVDVIAEALEREQAYTTVLSAMHFYFRNFKIQLHGCYVLLRFIELSPKIQSELQGKPEALRIILKIMSKYADKTCQVVGCKIISALCTCARTRREAVSKGAVDSVLYAISQFGEEEEFYIPAFKALTGLLADDTELQEKFMNMDVKNSRKKSYRMVVEIMEKHAKSGEIQEQGIQLLCVLAVSSKNCRTIVKGRTFIVALEAMKKHKEYLGVQAAGCQLLVLLAAFEHDREILVQQNVILLILRALREFKNSVEVQRNGFTALAQLAEALMNLVQDRIQNYSWTREVFAAMTTHCDKPEVLGAACRALEELIDVYPQALDGVGDDDDDNTIPLHRCIMAALMLHLDDPELCQEVCQVLASIVNYSSSLRESLISKGLYLHIIHAMKLHDKEPEVQQWGCRALRGLSLSGCGHKELLVNCGVLELVFNCTQRFENDVRVQEEAIALIACLATDVKLVGHQSAVEGIHSMILKAMDTFEEEMFLSEISLEALGVLTAAEEIPELLVSKNSDHRGVETIFNAMKRHQSEPAIQQKGCILIQVLASLLSDVHCQMAVLAISDAMYKFQDDRGVQAEGCVAMFVIAQIDTGKSEMLVNSGAHERLFFVMEHFGEEPELAYLASECIWYLGWERNLKQSMLMLACAKGLVIGADCLLKKGADVNASDGVNTPLSYACKNEREEMVKFLLTQGITDIQSALRLTLEMGYGNIVGLLLQHLGHDKEAGIIAFSSLNLGNLQPEWISPSLTGHKYTPPVLDSSWPELLEGAQRTMKNRATLSRHLSSERCEASSNDSLSCSNADSPFMGTSDTCETMVKSLSLESVDDPDSDDSSSDNELSVTDLTEESPLRAKSISGASFPFRSHDDNDNSDNELSVPNLTEESPLRARSISGASFPFSSRDPRIVSRYPDRNFVILPRSAHRRSFEEHLPNCPRPVLKRRAISDITPPFGSLDPFLTVPGTNKEALRQSVSPRQVEGIVESEEDVPLGVFKMPDLSYLYSWEKQGSFRAARSLSASDSYDGENSVSFGRRADFESQQKRRQSIQAISANPTVRLIDLSGNNMESLEPIAKATDELLAYLAKVGKLDLSRNQLSHFPVVFCLAMPVLECVNLSHNEFSVFPDCLVEETKVKMLNMSNNKINLMSHPPKFVQGAVMLESLNLSHNENSCLPDWFGKCFPALTHLYLVGNNIKTLPDCPLKMWRLKTLDLSNNKLKEIPPKFLAECFSLETLVASNNCLASLPEGIATSLTNLKTVRLNNNKLGEKSPRKQFLIPHFLLALPNVKVVDLSSNSLEDIPPPISWSTQQLKELVLADNKIRKLSLEGLEKWSLLERLILSDNNLKQVPRRIGELTSLMSLHLSRNTGITHLPDEMGRLSNLWDLELSGLKLDLDSAILESKVQELIGFLHSKLKNSVPYYRMKLVAVGQAGCGKTTLLNQLQENVATKPHHDIIVRDWYVKDTKAECKTCHRKCVNYVITTWDLKGRNDLHSAFQCLLSSRTLFLVIYDVSKGVNEIDSLRPWLLNINAHAPDASVMLVGTHKDKIPKDRVDDWLNDIKARSLDAFAGPGYPQVKSHVVLDCTQETCGVKMLRQRIMQLIPRCKCKGHALIGPQVPKNFIDLQDLILKEVPKHELPIFTMANVQTLIQERELLMDDAEVEQAIKFMNEAGVLVHHDDPACQLNDLLFVDPKWLFHLLAHLVTRKDSKNTNGILKLEELERLLRDGIGEVKEKPKLMPQLLRLLQHYCVALPLKDDRYLLPSLLSTKQPEVRIPNSQRNALLHRVYTMAYLPPSFWPRLITRVQTFVVNLYADHKALLESPREPQVKQWIGGVHVYWSDQAFFVISHGLSNPRPDTVVITTPNTKHGARILAHVVDHLDSLLQEWFPDLSCGVDPQNGLPLVRKEAACPVCLGDKAHTFSLESISQTTTDEFIMCPNTKLLVAMRQIAPDVIMEDVGEQFRIEESKLVVDISRSSLLGDGSFGAVYRASYDGKIVAAKVFHSKNENNPHLLLRQEVMFLRYLRHPSIINMVGACVKPWALIMELAPLGSLTTLLNRGKALSRGIQHRIALQVAEGMAFLHQHMIVYRDLKPHNILIFSLSPVNLINAKIADYGTARYATRCGLKTTEGTPGYRAPEVARGDIVYNTEADMYSFGMFLYELVTGGTRPFEDLRFRHELDAAVIKGRALDPITTSPSCPPWPDLADLIAHCLEPQPNRRATAEKAFSRLCNPELICLKREIAVCKGQAVECMAVRHFTEENTAKVEVWIGSGQSDFLNAQVTIIDLSESGVEGCTGTFIRDKRVTSIVAVDSNTVLVGTQSGTIWVFDAYNHKCQFDQPKLPGAVLCLRHHKVEARDEAGNGVNVVIAGLANGQLAVYDANSVKQAEAQPKYFDLCGSKFEGTSCDGCDIHPVACTAVGKKRLFCGCGNEVVVFRITEAAELEIERRWPVEDRAKGLVLNIAVGSSYVWTSTRDSPIIECWDFSKVKLVGHVDCLAILKGVGYTGENMRGARVLSLLLSHKTLWVGLGTGHVILVDPLTRKHLSVIQRHVSAVRCLCLADTSSPANTSLVLSGGMGFIERPGYKWKIAKDEFGYALVWEADFTEQAKNLESHIRKRRELTENN